MNTQITPAAIKTWSRLGQRATVFTAAMPEIGSEDANLKLLTADLALLTGMHRFIRTHPDKYLNVGIAEQNMVGIAAGLAMTGYNVFATTYSSYLVVRGLEHVRQHMAHMGYPIKLIGTSAGVVMAKSGVSHWCTEDIAFIRPLPKFTILSPADSLEAYKAVHAAAKLDTPVYVRLTGGLDCPMVYTEDYDFEIGKAVTLRKGNDVALVATGLMVNEALKTAELLEKQGISCTVVNMHTIKPLDTDTLDDVFKNHRLVVTVEEHNVVGGLGGAVAEYKATFAEAPRQVFLGFSDFDVQAGGVRYMWNQVGLTDEKIARRVAQELS